MSANDSSGGASTAESLEKVIESFKKELAAAAGAEYCVFYLDDETEIFGAFAPLVARFGLKLITARSIPEGLELITKNQQKLVFIISDYRMPEGDGFEFREQVLKITPLIPFAILSGFIDKDMALRGLDLKISGFLDKPFDKGELAKLFLKEALPRLKTLIEEAELLRGFVEETKNLIEEGEELLLYLENEPTHPESINKFFGIIHTIKGASSFFEPKTLHRFAHRFEELLKQIQRGELIPTSEVVSSLLKGLDIIKSMMGDFGSETPQTYDVEALVSELFAFEREAAENPEKAGEKDQKTDDPGAAPAPKVNTLQRQTDIKVSISILDQFMQTSGEMTVIRNMLNKCVRSIERQYSGDKEIATLVELLEELHKINGDVQHKVTELRKITIRNIVKPLPRAVRDVARALKKEVDLQINGEDLRVDTSIADVLSNCLLHMVKNSIDHGLESPSEREVIGKRKAGSISITAGVKNDQVLVVIEDDGKGIDAKSIQSKLIKNGSHTLEQVEAMKDEDLYAMIFEAGFSTAAEVTDISGRGVGMSMVKSSVTAVGGVIKIQSTAGQGTKFTLSLPIPKSVLITNCLFVKCRTDQFGVVQEDIVRVLRIQPDQVAAQIREMEGTRAVLMEQELIPIVELSDMLEVSSGQVRTQEQDVHLVVLASPDHSKKLALRVDAILDVEDTVIKSLQFQVNSSGMYRGATFLGDGRIGLIISTTGLFEKAHLEKTEHSGEGRTRIAAETVAVHQDELERVLLFELSLSGIYGISQRTVFRIEDIDLSKAGAVGGVMVLPYRNQTLTLIEVSSTLFGVPGRSQGLVPVVIIEYKNRLVGLVVKTVWDVAQIPVASGDMANLALGIRGHSTHGNKIVTLIDLDVLAQKGLAFTEQNLKAAA